MNATMRTLVCSVPAASLERTQVRLANSVARYLDAGRVVGLDRSTSGGLPTSAIYADYVGWAANQGLPVVGPGSFATRLAIYRPGWCTRTIRRDGRHARGRVARWADGVTPYAA